MEQNEERAMKQRSVVALDADDSYFNDWMIDLFSLERYSSAKWNETLWAGVQPTYASILVRPN
jgi:hypothetical protein